MIELLVLNNTKGRKKGKSDICTPRADLGTVEVFILLFERGEKRRISRIFTFSEESQGGGPD